MKGRATPPTESWYLWRLYTFWPLIIAVSLIWHLPASGQDAVKVHKLSERSSEDILADEGLKVRVMGFVDRTNQSATGIHFLDFKDSDFVCVTFPQYLGAFGEAPPKEAYLEKWIEVTGKIENFRGKPQIRLTSPDQVKVVPGPPPPKPPEPKKDPEPTEEKDRETREKKENESEAQVEAETSKLPQPKEKPNRVVEVIDGVQAIEWRKYFPEKRKNEK